MKAVKLTFSLLIIAVLGGGAYVFYQWSKQPAVTRVATKSAQNKQVETAKVDIKTKYFVSAFKGQYEVSRLDETAQSPQLLQMVIRHTEPRLTDQIAITISESIEGIEESSSVQVRKRNPEMYQQNSDPALRQGAISFKKTSGGYEKSVFWAEGGKHISVVGSATIDRGSMVEVAMDELVGNWQWRSE